MPEVIVWPKAILPVLVSPMVKVCLAVVEMVAAEEKMRFPAEVAVPVRPKIWNLAEEVAVPLSIHHQ